MQTKNKRSPTVAEAAHISRIKEMEPQCSAPACGLKTHARGLCPKHYQRQMRLGTLVLSGQPQRVPTQVVLDGIEMDETAGCWIWAKARNAGGYGRLLYRGKHYVAHRFSWLAFGGTLPRGLQVNHTCHNRACVNPTHLYVGTQLQNMADMRAAGRGRHAQGEENGLSKLTAGAVVSIRQSGETTAALARKLSVSESLIRAVRQRLVWRHVGAE